jgi:hypothetical protein
VLGYGGRRPLSVAGFGWPWQASQVFLVLDYCFLVPAGAVVDCLMTKPTVTSVQRK